MPVVRSTFVDAAAVPLKDTWVRVSLVSRAGWSKDGTRKVTRIHSDLTDSTGLWTSPDLPGNSTYEETGTYYQVECNGVVESFDVPATGGPYQLSDRRRSPVPIDGDWKVLPKFSELPDALALASLGDGQVPVWNNTTKRLEPGNRVTSQQLADAIGPLALKTYVDNADQGLSNRVAPLENWKPTVDTALGQKANTTTVTGLSDKVTTNTNGIANHESRIKTLEGGGSGGSGGTGAIRHSALQNLQYQTDGTTIADDHPQYLTAGRGDDRYYTKSTSDSRYAGITHAARHATGGGDPITPASIGASSTAHAIDGHAATGQLRPLIIVSTSAATTSAPAHSALTSDVPATYSPRTRSLRQPITHAFDVDITDLVVGKTDGNLLFTYDFTTREQCELALDLTMYGYYASSNPPTGATAQATIALYIYDRDATNTPSVYTNDPFHTMAAVSGYAGFRTNEQNNVRMVLDNVTFRQNGRYRMRLWGTKDPVANADLMLQSVRGSLTEVVCA